MQMQPSGTVTLVFTDIEGSTQLLSDLGRERYLEALTEHRRAIRDAFARFDGYEVDYEGDSFFYAFQSASAAVSAVREGTAALRDGPILIRVGIHTGEPGLDLPKYVGLDVHRAARIMACAHGGQALLSQTTRELLEDEDGLRDLGEHRLKDLSAPIRLYQLGDGEFPPLRSLYRTNLPVPATAFLGREKELAEIEGLLQTEDVRLLTLTGPGGTGKTRLALQAAAESTERYPDGIWWLPLASIRDPALLLPAAAQVLEVKEQPGHDLADTLAERLDGKRTLLLLDNVEHLLPEAATAIARLCEVDGPRVVVTSRERLQLGGEQLYPVPALDDADAVELFTARARQLDPGFEPGPAVEELCLRLDNLPLAIELAAARTTLFDVEQLLEHLARPLDLLKGGRDADARQQTLRATIDWSYRLLGADEQRVFRALSVFAGGCTLEAAESVCDTNPDVLQSLLDKSLLRRRAGPRYWLLETLREFAAERLHEASEDDMVRDRHATWCLALARETDGIVSASPFEARERLNEDGANMMAALAWTLEAGDARSLRLGVGVTRVWMVRGFNERAWQAGRRALAFRGAGHDVDRACLMCIVASTGFFQGEFQEVRLLTEGALTTLRAAGLDRGVAWALELLGGALLAEGNTAGALAALDEGIEVARRCEPPWPLAALLNDRGSAALEAGDLAGARELLDESVRVGPNAGNLGGLAEVAFAEGRFDEARDCLARAIEGAAGHLLWLGGALVCQAAVEEATGARERAVTLLGAADRMGEESGVVYYGFSTGTEGRISAVRALAASHEWRPAWEAGRAMSIDEAMAYALGTPDETGGA